MLRSATPQHASVGFSGDQISKESFEPRVQQGISVVSLRYDIAEGLPPTETLQHGLCDSMHALGQILEYEIFIRAAR